MEYFGKKVTVKVFEVTARLMVRTRLLDLCDACTLPYTCRAPHCHASLSCSSLIWQACFDKPDITLDTVEAIQEDLLKLIPLDPRGRIMFDYEQEDNRDELQIIDDLEKEEEENKSEVYASLELQLGTTVGTTVGSLGRRIVPTRSPDI